MQSRWFFGQCASPQYPSSNVLTPSAAPRLSLSHFYKPHQSCLCLRRYLKLRGDKSVMEVDFGVRNAGPNKRRPPICPGADQRVEGLSRLLQPHEARIQLESFGSTTSLCNITRVSPRTCQVQGPLEGYHHGMHECRPNLEEMLLSCGTTWYLNSEIEYPDASFAKHPQKLCILRSTAESDGWLDLERALQPTSDQSAALQNGKSRSSDSSLRCQTLT